MKPSPFTVCEESISQFGMGHNIDDGAFTGRLLDGDASPFVPLEITPEASLVSAPVEPNGIPRLHRSGMRQRRLQIPGPLDSAISFRFAIGSDMEFSCHDP
ncbi:MAG: hypothetical protein QF473_12315 [Planctomycetota bacterium]|nr:hypothetical protein [Planctomycetota bacterium]